MEALGGNESAWDRGLAQSLAFLYYWYVCAAYAAHPRLAYHLSELVEDHAYETYDAFLADHADALRAAPVPDVARSYYDAVDAPLRDLATRTAPPREPLANLFDVFVRVRDDERAHWETLVGLVQYDGRAGDAGAPEATRPCVVVGDECVLPADDECAAEPVLVASR